MSWLIVLHGSCALLLILKNCIWRDQKEMWKAEAAQFANETSSHGIGRVARTMRPKWYRIFWLMISLTGIGLAIYTGIDRVTYYLTYPYHMTLMVNSSKPIPFPAVTVCSAFPFPTLGEDGAKAREAIDAIKTARCYTNETLRDHAAHQVELNTPSKMISWCLFLAMTGAEQLYSVLDGNVSDIGFAGDSFMVHCSYNRKPCRQTVSFTRHTTSDFYNCYTIDVGDDHTTTFKRMKLMLYLSSSAEGITYNFSDVIDFHKGGVYVQVHESGVHPEPDNYGVGIRPGTFNRLSLTASHHTLLSNPFHTNCSKQTKMAEYKYNSHICYKVCKQKLVTEKCGCPYAGIHYRKPDTAVNDTFCLSDYCHGNLVNSQIQCIQDFYGQEETTVMCDQCQQPACNRWEYHSKHAAFGHFKTNNAAQALFDLLPPNHTAYRDVKAVFGDFNNVTSSFILNNFAEVLLQFSDTRVRVHTAERLETVLSLLSELGGAFGFWIGFSVITFIEVFEWWIRTGRACCTAASTKPANKTATEDESEMS